MQRVLGIGIRQVRRALQRRHLPTPSRRRCRQVRKAGSRAVLLTCAVALSACTSMRTVVDRGSADAATPAFNRVLLPGDKVRITTLDNAQQTLVVSDVSADRIDGVREDTGAHGSVQADQVRRIEKQEKSGVKTGALVATLSAVLVTILIVLSVRAAGPGLSGG